MRTDQRGKSAVDMYDSFVIREALNNCIAHQDYSLRGRIQVVENEDRFLTFTNKGEFLPGSIDNVIRTDAPQEVYHNKFLVEAMANLIMIDTIGSGIKRMFTVQKERLFPLPSYYFDDARVKVTIFGKILNKDYVSILNNNSDLELFDIILLDNIQKDINITKEQAGYLRQKKLIEGRYPNLYMSKSLAEGINQKNIYIKTKRFKDGHYRELVLQYLKEYPMGASRSDIDNLLIDILPNFYDDKQKKNKISNLLADLRMNKLIKNKGNNRKACWILVRSIK